MDFLSADLTIEQQFHLRTMEQSVKDMDREQAMDQLLRLMQLLMVKDNVIRDLMKRVPL